jgi:hypothetical protein
LIALGARGVSDRMMEIILQFFCKGKAALPTVGGYRLVSEGPEQGLCHDGLCSVKVFFYIYYLDAPAKWRVYFLFL